MAAAMAMAWLLMMWTVVLLLLLVDSEAAVGEVEHHQHPTSAGSKINHHLQNHRLRRNDEEDQRTLIVNGEDAITSEYPFFVRSSPDNVGITYDLVCGATLIWSDMILTAGHCQGAFNFGALVYDPTFRSYTRLRAVDFQRVYPEYHTDKSLINYDIMVLRLSDPVTDVQPVGLNADPNFPTESDRVHATGFGITDYQAAIETNGATGGMPSHLQVGYFQALTTEECSSRGRFSNVRIQDDILCVDPWEDESICSGDSGGPLTIPVSPQVDVEQLHNVEAGGGDGRSSINSVINGMPQAIQVGVSSFGTDCQADHVPDGFARVSFFHDWIVEQICELSRYPPVDCPPITEGDDVDQNQEDAIDIQLAFRHDFLAQETTFIVRNLVTNAIEYAGPEYVPRRGEEVVTTFSLSPGRYTFEVYDYGGDGLRNPDFVRTDYPEGQWEMVAVYPNGARIELGRGGADFETQQTTTIVVEEFAPGFTAAPSSAPTTSPSIAPTGSPTVTPSSMADATIASATLMPIDSTTTESDDGDSVDLPNDEAATNDPSSASNDDLPWLYRLFINSYASSLSGRSWTWVSASVLTGLCLVLAY